MVPVFIVIVIIGTGLNTVQRRLRSRATSQFLSLSTNSNWKLKYSDDQKFLFQVSET